LSGLVLRVNGKYLVETSDLVGRFGVGGSKPVPGDFICRINFDGFPEDQLGFVLAASFEELNALLG
jgi:hypothetical protein